MSQGEQHIIKVQIHHELIGNHNFQLSGKTHTSDLRLHILENSPLYIHENFHLEHQGTRLQECNEISQIFKTDVRLAVVFDPYDQYSSRYHQMQVRKILANPAQWAVANSRDLSNKVGEDEKQNFPSLSLDTLFQDPFSSVLLEGAEKMENDFSNIIHPSGFNPPSAQRKFLGDLYYLQLKSLEETDFHITANSYGFYVNQSTQGNFNPHPNPKFSSCISLLDLLFQISPKFKTKFQDVLKGVKVSEFQRLSQGQKVITTNTSWMQESVNWKKSNSWKNDSFQYGYKNDYTVIKDWVQIFQYQQTSSSDSLFEKLGKEKLRYRIYQEFTQSVKDCVMKIFNGTLEPLNTAAKLEHRIFYYSGLLFYFANDDLKSDRIRPSGYSVNKQIIVEGMLEQVDIDNVYLSHSAVVNYRGFKIVAKAIPSCLIKSTQENNTVKDIFMRQNKAQNDELILGALKKISKSLGLESEVLTVDENGLPKMLCVSQELTACISNETKRFLLQTKGFSVRDLNFNQQDPNQCYLRPQLIKIYNTNQKCQILFNSSIGIGCTLSNTEKYKQQLKKLQSVAKFAKEIMVPSVIDNFDGDMRKYLSDSHSIIYVLHKFGLSCKYLGLICSKASQKKIEHVKIMIQRAILVRSLKSLFKSALRYTPLFLHKTVIKNLLNCLFGDQQNKDNNHKDVKTDDETDLNVTSKKNKKRKNKENETYFEITFAKSEEKYCKITEEDFWEELKEVALKKFKHQLSNKHSFFVFQFSKIAILRDLCLCLGVVLEKRDYFSGEGPATFTEENIINLYPKIKIVATDPKQLDELIEQGDKQTNKFQIQEAFDAYNKAFQYIFSSFGESHEKLGLMYKKFAGLHYRIGDLDAAVLFALNSFEIYEHLRGKDHIQTIEALMMVGIYEFGRKRFAAAEYYMLKAIFLAKLSYSECYPEVMVMFMNISTVYQAQRKYTDAIMSLFMALNISIKVYGQIHLHTAIVFSALASLHYDIPDIEQTIKFQQRSIAILEQILGNEDQRVIEAKNTCEGYKNIQNSKKVREVHEKEQRNAYGLPSMGKFNMKTPFYDMRERGSSDFFWKKSRRLKYFF